MVVTSLHSGRIKFYLYDMDYIKLYLECQYLFKNNFKFFLYAWEGMRNFEFSHMIYTL